MPKRETIAQTAARLRYYPCAVPDCHGFRDRISRWCRLHKDRYDKYGSTTMTTKLIERRHYKRERTEVRAFLKRHVEHVAVNAGISWIQTWLHSGDATGDKVSQNLARLRDAGAKPLDLLIEVSALFLYSQRYVWINDDVPLTFAMASAVLGLAPRKSSPSYRNKRDGVAYNKPTGLTRRTIGESLRAALAPLLANIAKSIMAAKAEHKDQQAGMRTPFDAETAVTANGSTIYKMTAPCRWGHLGWRYATGGCMDCVNERNKKRNWRTGRPVGRPTLATRIAWAKEELEKKTASSTATTTTTTTTTTMKENTE